MSNKLYQIEKNAEDIRKTVLTNCVKMLTERGMFNKENLQNRIDTVLKRQTDVSTYELGETGGKKVICKLIPHKITAINKSYGLMEFLEEYKNAKKFVVLKDINKRVLQHALSIDITSEVFLEKELMINLVDHDLVPKHIVLTKEESDEVLKTYIAKKKNMPKILSNDRVARYYGVKVGDIFKIIRPSEKSGLVPTYRLVIKGTL